MKKLKIYLDTSVISHLDAPDALEKMRDTLKLWEKIKADEFEVVLSAAVFLELDGCKDSKREKLYDYLSEITYTSIEINNEVMSIADKLVEYKVLSERHLRDRQHIAAAIVSECDMIVSWNFSHIVNYKTIGGVKIVTIATGYRELAIYHPTILVEGENNDDE